MMRICRSDGAETPHGKAENYFRKAKNKSGKAEHHSEKRKANQESRKTGAGLVDLSLKVVYLSDPCQFVLPLNPILRYIVKG